MNPRDEKGEAQALLKDYLHTIRSQFYSGEDDRYYKHRFMLVQAIAWPAKVVKELGVWLPPNRLREILDEIIKGIKQKGKTGKIDHFAGYFLVCVQSHMRVRQDHYYREGKTARSLGLNSMPLADILKGVTVTDQADEGSPEQVVEDLVKLAATFKPRRRQKKSDSQMDLFG